MISFGNRVLAEKGRLGRSFVEGAADQFAHDLATTLANLDLVARLRERSGQVAHSNVGHCWRGQNWTWDGVKFEILHPDVEDNFTGNNLSCVLRVSNARFSLLLTGDIEKQAERKLLSREKQALKSTIVVAPHHGSRTSSTSSFVSAVSPEYALFASGYRNRFGFPKQDIIARYQQHDAVILNTAEHGALEFKLGKSALSYRSYRKYARRIWNRRVINQDQQE